MDDEPSRTSVRELVNRFNNTNSSRFPPTQLSRAASTLTTKQVAGGGRRRAEEQDADPKQQQQQQQQQQQHTSTPPLSPSSSDGGGGGEAAECAPPVDLPPACDTSKESCSRESTDDLPLSHVHDDFINDDVTCNDQWEKDLVTKCQNTKGTTPAKDDDITSTCSFSSCSSSSTAPSIASASSKDSTDSAYFSELAMQGISFFPNTTAGTMEGGEDDLALLEQQELPIITVVQNEEHVTPPTTTQAAEEIPMRCSGSGDNFDLIVAGVLLAVCQRVEIRSASKTNSPLFFEEEQEKNCRRVINAAHIFQTPSSIVPRLPIQDNSFLDITEGTPQDVAASEPVGGDPGLAHQMSGFACPLENSSDVLDDRSCDLHEGGVAELCLGGGQQQPEKPILDEIRIADDRLSSWGSGSSSAATTTPLSGVLDDISVTSPTSSSVSVKASSVFSDAIRQRRNQHRNRASLGKAFTSTLSVIESISSSSLASESAASVEYSDRILPVSHAKSITDDLLCSLAHSDISTLSSPPSFFTKSSADERTSDAASTSSLPEDDAQSMRSTTSSTSKNLAELVRRRRLQLRSRSAAAKGGAKGRESHLLLPTSTTDEKSVPADQPLAPIENLSAEKSDDEDFWAQELGFVEEDFEKGVPGVLFSEVLASAAAATVAAETSAIVLIEKCIVSSKDSIGVHENDDLFDNLSCFTEGVLVFERQQEGGEMQQAGKQLVDDESTIAVALPADKTTMEELERTAHQTDLQSDVFAGLSYSSSEDEDLVLGDFLSSLSPPSRPLLNPKFDAADSKMRLDDVSSIGLDKLQDLSAIATSRALSSVSSESSIISSSILHDNERRAFENYHRSIRDSPIVRALSFSEDEKEIDPVDTCQLVKEGALKVAAGAVGLCFLGAVVGARAIKVGVQGLDDWDENRKARIIEAENDRKHEERKAEEARTKYIVDRASEAVLTWRIAVSRRGKGIVNEHHVKEEAIDIEHLPRGHRDVWARWDSVDARMAKKEQNDIETFAKESADARVLMLSKREKEMELRKSEKFQREAEEEAISMLAQEHATERERVKETEMIARRRAAGVFKNGSEKMPPQQHLKTGEKFGDVRPDAASQAPKNEGGGEGRQAEGSIAATAEKKKAKQKHMKTPYFFSALDEEERPRTLSDPATAALFDEYESYEVVVKSTENKRRNDPPVHDLPPAIIDPPPAGVSAEDADSIVDEAVEMMPTVPIERILPMQPEEAVKKRGRLVGGMKRLLGKFGSVSSSATAAMKGGGEKERKGREVGGDSEQRQRILMQQKAISSYDGLSHEQVSEMKQKLEAKYSKFFAQGKTAEAKSGSKGGGGGKALHSP